MKVGDKVRHLIKGIGTVLYTDTSEPSVGVEYDNWDKGHNLEAVKEAKAKVTKERHCYWEYYHDLVYDKSSLETVVEKVIKRLRSK